MINEAVLRDRKPHPPMSVDELQIVPGAREALTLLRELGFRLLAVTNQPDVARGQQTREAVEAMHARLMGELPLDQIYTCYHDDRDGCECRKPKPGLILQAATEWDIDPTESFMIGDRWKDVEAGRRAGAVTFLIGMGYAERQTAKPDYRVGDLIEAARIIKDLRS